MSDLRDRLAEALENVSADHDIPMPGFYTTADAILAAFPELERRYEVGAAVEELLPPGQSASIDHWHSGQWLVTAWAGDGPSQRGAGGPSDTIPDAIRAAMEDEADRDELAASIDHYRNTPSTAFVKLEDER